MSEIVSVLKSLLYFYGTQILVGLIVTIIIILAFIVLVLGGSYTGMESVTSGGLSGLLVGGLKGILLFIPVAFTTILLGEMAALSLYENTRGCYLETSK